MTMLLVRLLGIVDIISALIIIYNVYNIHWVITTGHALILILKGTPSIFYDAPGVVMGLTDVAAALFIIFAVTGLLPLKIVLFVILVGKGAMSLI